VLKAKAWVGDLLPDVDVSGFMIREEFTAALQAAIEYYTRGTYQFETTPDENDENDAMQIDSGACFPNPFSKLSPSFASTRGGFILLGHPGIGKRYISS
jgi:hypothetical protein